MSRLSDYLRKNKGSLIKALIEALKKRFGK